MPLILTSTSHNFFFDPPGYTNGVCMYRQHGHCMAQADTAVVACQTAMGESPVGMRSEPQLHQMQMLLESHLVSGQERLA